MLTFNVTKLKPILILLWFVLFATVASASPKSIISESQTIAQKKGESLSQALSSVKLSAYQQKIIANSSLNRIAGKTKRLKFIFELKDSKKLLKGVVVETKDTKIYKIFFIDGIHQLKLQSVTSIPINKLSISKYFDFGISRASLSKKTKHKNNKKTQEKNTKKKEVVVNRVKSLSKKKVSPSQQVLLESNKLQKKVSPVVLESTINKPSKNTIHLTTVDDVNNNKKTYRIIDSLGDSKESAYKPLKKAKHKREVKRKNEPKKLKKPSSIKKINSAVYKKVVNKKTTILRILQKKRESLSSALKKANLSVLQKNLIYKVPANKRAITNRYIFLLLENKLLKSIYFVRGNRTIGYALIEHRGTLSWVNKKAEIFTEKKNFNRYPLKNPRVSSHYNLRRKHPITGRTRPHRGTDFKASHGTPIFAPYDGVVKFAGRKSGFGITLEINHRNGYKTLYAHLSKIQKIARKKGNKISKGDLIARVGSTGMSTGAHLHYEIKVDGKHKNPMKVKLPRAPAKKITSASQKAVEVYLDKLKQYANHWK